MSDSGRSATTHSARGAGLLVAACALAGSALGGGALAGCATIERRVAREQVEVVPDLVYVPGGANPKHALDLYLPRGKTGFPLVVFIHGGYWRAGDRNYFSWAVGLYGSVGLALAKRGIGAAVISYRLSSEVPIEGSIEDVARAVRWAFDHAAEHGAAPDRIFLAGHSAGGHLAALLASDPRHLRAVGLDPAQLRGVIALAPVLDLAQMQASNDEAFNRKITEPAFGTDASGPLPADALAARLAEFSPVSHFGKEQPPMLLVIGGEDTPYIAGQVKAAYARLQALGAPVELRVLPGLSHIDLVRQMGDDGDMVTPWVAAYVMRTAGR